MWFRRYWQTRISARSVKWTGACALSLAADDSRYEARVNALAFPVTKRVVGKNVTAKTMSMTKPET